MTHRPDTDPESGAALFSTLLIIAAMTIAALVAMTALTSALQLARIGDSRTDGFWQVRSSEVAGQAILADLIDRTDGKLTERTPGLGEVIEFPLQSGGLVSARIQDGTNCFNLNALAVPGDGGWAINDDALDAFKALLLALDLSLYEADQLSGALADWIDTDSLVRPNGAEDPGYSQLDPPYRTAGAPLQGWRELRAIGPYTPELIERLRPVACVRPTYRQSVLNINTLTPLQAPLLSALYASELTPQDARRVLEQRPTTGWSSIEELREVDIIKAITLTQIDPGAVDTRSTWFRIDGSVYTSGLHNRFELLYAVESDGRTALVWRRYGED